MGSVSLSWHWSCSTNCSVSLGFSGGMNHFLVFVKYPCDFLPKLRAIIDPLGVDYILSVKTFRRVALFRLRHGMPVNFIQSAMRMSPARSSFRAVSGEELNEGK